MTSDQLQLGDDRRVRELGYAAELVRRAHGIVAHHERVTGHSTLRYLSRSLGTDHQCLRNVARRGCGVQR